MWVDIPTKLKSIAKPSILPCPNGCLIREMDMENLIVVTEKDVF